MGKSYQKLTERVWCHIIRPNLYKYLVLFSHPLTLYFLNIYFCCISIYLIFYFPLLLSCLFYKCILNFNFIKKNYLEMVFQTHKIHFRFNLESLEKEKITKHDLNNRWPTFHSGKRSPVYESIWWIDYPSY